MSAPSEDHPRILLVDDEPDILAYLKEMIARGYPNASVILAPNAAEGLDVLRSRTVDLIMSDYHMPGVDGVTMLTTARTLAPHALRVLLTGHADLQTAQRAVNEGQIHAFFQKPVKAAVLMTTLGRLLAQTAQQVERGPSARSPEFREIPVVGDAPQTSATPRVLVVDDVVEVADLFRSFASRLPPGSVDIVVERDPREALRRIERGTFAGIISDHNMPHVKGTQLLRAARRIQPSARRVLMTGYNEIPDTMGALDEASIDAYVEKPISRQATLDLLLAIVSEDPRAMDAYRAQARIATRGADREPRAAASP